MELDVVYRLQKFKQNGRRLYCSNQLIRIFNFLYFPNVTLKTWRAYSFSASQIDCRPTPLESQMRADKHQTDMDFADFSVNNTQPIFIKLYMHTRFSIVMLFQKLYVMKF